MNKLDINFSRIEKQLRSKLPSSEILQVIDFKPVKMLLAGGITFSVFRAILQWAAPWPLKLIFDNVLANHSVPSILSRMPSSPTGRLEVLTAATAIIALLLGLSSYGANALLANAGQRIVFDLKCRLFRHIEEQSMTFHFRNSIGDLLSRLGGDVQAMQGMVVNVLPVTAESVLTISGMIAIMLFIDWHFSLIVFALAPALFFTLRHYLSAIKATQRNARRNEGKASSLAQQVLLAIPLVQVSGTEESEGHHYATVAQEGLEANKKAVLLQSRFTPIVNVIMTLSGALVLYFGAQSVLRGTLTAGDLLVFMAYLRGIYSPMRQLAKTAGALGRGQASAERVVETLNSKEHVIERPFAIHMPKVRGNISFSNVWFSYPNSEPALSGVSFEVRAGTQHALIGATGSGKTTVLRLLPRFIDPHHGSVKLDGIDLRDLPLESLRQKIALVSQDPFLLGETVWENIAYGLSNPTKEEAVRIAKNCGVDGVFSGLQNGYDTRVGERGSALSGGQRQCISVARAMGRSAPIILLDEPTTGLDASAEAVLLEALSRLTEGRTTIMVTHNLDIVQSADRITVMSNGSTVEEGTHESLLRNRSHYWELQHSMLLLARSPGQGN